MCPNVALLRLPSRQPSRASARKWLWRLLEAVMALVTPISSRGQQRPASAPSMWSGQPTVRQLLTSHASSLALLPCHCQHHSNRSDGGTGTAAAAGASCLQCSICLKGCAVCCSSMPAQECGKCTTCCTGTQCGGKPQVQKQAAAAVAVSAAAAAAAVLAPACPGGGCGSSAGSAASSSGRHGYRRSIIPTFFHAA